MRIRMLFLLALKAALIAVAVAQTDASSLAR